MSRGSPFRNVQNVKSVFVVHETKTKVFFTAKKVFPGSNFLLINPLTTPLVKKYQRFVAAFSTSFVVYFVIYFRLEYKFAFYDLAPSSGYKRIVESLRSSTHILAPFYARQNVQRMRI